MTQTMTGLITGAGSGIGEAPAPKSAAFMNMRSRLRAAVGIQDLAQRGEGALFRSYSSAAAESAVRSWRTLETHDLLHRQLSETLDSLTWSNRRCQAMKPVCEGGSLVCGEAFGE